MLAVTNQPDGPMASVSRMDGLNKPPSLAVSANLFTQSSILKLWTLIWVQRMCLNRASSASRTCSYGFGRLIDQADETWASRKALELAMPSHCLRAASAASKIPVFITGSFGTGNGGICTAREESFPNAPLSFVIASSRRAGAWIASAKRDCCLIRSWFHSDRNCS